MSAPAEPICCGVSMVHNSWTSAYECADAYLRLLDDGVVEDLPLTGDELADVSAFHRGLHEHWTASMVTDCCGAPTTLHTDPRLQVHGEGCTG